MVSLRYRTISDIKTIATFDTQKMAEDYIDKSYLKNRKQWCPFRKSSLLAYCSSEDLYIEDVDTPHNP